MNYLVRNEAVAGLMLALYIQQQLGQCICVRVLDEYEAEDEAIIRLGPATLNFVVRDLGISLPTLMTGVRPGIFNLGMVIKPCAAIEPATVSHAPTRAQLGLMPANYALERLQRVGGKEKLERYSLAAQMIKVNSMALPNKKGECPLGDDEIGISICLEHLRRMLILRLEQAGVQVAKFSTENIHTDVDGVYVRFADGSSGVFDAVISTLPNIDQRTNISIQQTIEWTATDQLPNPAAQLAFDQFGWVISEAIAQGKQRVFYSLNSGDHERVLINNDLREAQTRNKLTDWFSAHWQGREVSIADYDFFGSQFLLDPLQPIVRAVQLLIQLLPANNSANLLARYFNERMEGIGLACREYSVAHLLDGAVGNSEQLISSPDREGYWARRHLFATVGEHPQPAANIIGDDLWAAYWHMRGVLPQYGSNLQRSFDLEGILLQACAIEKNITEIIPRLPTHQYYISLLNGGRL